MRHLKGFTLVELLVVIAIIAVLLAILLPALSSVNEIGKRIRCGFNIKGITKGISFYADDNSGKLPYLRSNRFATAEEGRSEEGHPYVAYRDDYFKQGTTQLLPLRLACLFDSRIIENPKTFYCPAAINDKWEEYIDPLPWGKLPQKSNTDSGSNQWVRVSYLYYPLNKSKAPTATLYNSAMKLVDAHPNKPWVTDTLWTLETLNHKAGNQELPKGIYGGFPDGHVNFCSNQDIFSTKYWPLVGSGLALRPQTVEFENLLRAFEP